MSESVVLCERDGRRATITLRRPPLNILDIATIATLDAALAELERDPGLQVVVLRGNDKAFSAGVSIQDHTPDKVATMLSGFHGAIRRLRDLPAITLAAVDGHCLGGGMELALACDLVLATASSKFGQPEIHLGCYPPVAAALYPNRIGSARTFEMLLTGRTYTAEELEIWGILNWRVPRGDFEAKLQSVCNDLMSKSAAVLQLTKRAIRAGEERAFAPALDEAERIYLQELCKTADIEEGIDAFLHKRKPEWRHE